MQTLANENMIMVAADDKRDNRKVTMHWVKSNARKGGVTEGRKGGCMINQLGARLLNPDINPPPD